MDDFAEFRHFRYLLAIAEYGGFRAAAEALHTSQPSLSRQIKEFQERYRIRLFRRLKDGRIGLTPAGEAVRVIARDVLETRDLALAALEAIHRGEADLLRIGCTPFIDKDICRRAAELQKALVPASTIRFSSDDTAAILSELRQDQLDAAIVSLPVTDDNLRIEIVKRERLVACLPADHPAAKKAALNAADLAENLRIFRRPSHHPDAHQRLRELLAELGVRFEEHSHASHPQEMQEAVQNGGGFALLREGATLLPGLTTRPVLGVEWTVDTAIIFKINPKSKVIPIIAKNLKRHFLIEASSRSDKKSSASSKRNEDPPQMKLLA
jgi:DNA-binding transcriptional LysR family regulator